MPPVPPITSTRHTLPFDKLSPLDFERVCLWLVERQGFDRAEHLGASGNEHGRDIVAWKGERRFAFQCKRVKRFGPKDAESEIEKLKNLRKKKTPEDVVFIVTCSVSAAARDRARKNWSADHGCIHFWVGSKLDEMVKRHEDIIHEFFRGWTRVEELTTPPVGVTSSPKTTKALEAALKAVLGASNTAWSIKGAATFVAELSPIFDRLPDDQRAALAQATGQAIRDALNILDIASQNAALSAVGVETLLKRVTALLTPQTHSLWNEHIQVFDAYLADRTHGFVGRRFVYALLDDFICAPSPVQYRRAQQSRYFIQPVDRDRVGWQAGSEVRSQQSGA